MKDAVTHDPVRDAIARGDAVAEVLILHRDAVIEHLAAVLLIGGVDGVRACAAGAAEAVVLAHERRARGVPEEGSVLPFPPRVAGEGRP